MELELKEGFMTTEELAKWAQLSSSHIMKNKKSWCEKFLSKYAIYELKRGGIEIIQVLQPVFRTTLKTKVENNFDACYGDGEHKVDKCKNVSEKIQKKLDDPNVNANTVYQYVCSTKREWYGVSNQREGSKGHCKNVLCKIVNGQPTIFTEEEIVIRNRLMNKYLKSRSQQVIDMRAAKQAFENHEITKEEYDQVIDELLDTDKDWVGFLEEFEKQIGYPVDFGIEIIDNAIKIHSGKYEF